MAEVAAKEELWITAKQRNAEWEKEEGERIYLEPKNVGILSFPFGSKR
ncbi:hypothetical protein CCACVL1_06883 [Corchorus capsularis]|uniref:Uncharacterized protein n=1 Tax=Corchorus capsularis TaxID=210143 RepID=A0A1R3JC12_COCAP|nr:hypothetical protein CCACVL1_06883 [Corchorus capsularis]